MSAGVLGCITTPKQGNLVPPGAVYCADNGCFGKGYPGDDAWWSWVQALENRHLCRFVVAPDVVGDAAATLARSRPWLARVRSLGLPVAYVAQDGFAATEVPWDEFDVLFIGGTDEFKLGPAGRDAIAAGKAHGKWVHCGRVNSEKRYRLMARLGCDSADGTCLTWGVEANLPRVRGWLRSIDQTAFDLESAS